MRLKRVIASTLLALFGSGVGLAVTATPAAASQIRELPKVSQQTLKTNCKEGGGTYGENKHGSYWCSFNGGETIVLCPKKAQNCYGLTPRQLQPVISAE